MAEIVRVNRDDPEPEVIARAAEMIRKGGVVAIPTDTFYGLAANPFDPGAVERVFEIKGRAKQMPLLLLVDSAGMARGLAKKLPGAFERLAERFWPGPLTMVVDAATNVPGAVTSGTGRIGLRWPRAAVAVAIVRQAGIPIVGTSANRSGEKECATAREVDQQIGAAVPLILDGGKSEATGASILRASTVIDVREDGWDVLREGAIEKTKIARALGEISESERGA